VVKLEYDPQTMVAREVEMERKDKDKEQPRAEPRRSERAKVEGTITAVDPAKGTLTIFTKNGETRVITIRSDTAMAFNKNRIAALSQLPLAAAVKVEVTEGNVAIKIEAEKRGPDTQRDKPRGDKTREDKGR
jgi:hypothetical protein